MTSTTHPTTQLPPNNTGPPTTQTPPPSTTQTTPPHPQANLIEAEREGLEHPEAVAALTANEDVLGRRGAPPTALPASASAASLEAVVKAGEGGAKGKKGGKKEEEPPGQVRREVLIDCTGRGGG